MMSRRLARIALWLAALLLLPGCTVPVPWNRPTPAPTATVVDDAGRQDAANPTVAVAAEEATSTATPTGTATAVLVTPIPLFESASTPTPTPGSEAASVTVIVPSPTAALTPTMPASDFVFEGRSMTCRVRSGWEIDEAQDGSLALVRGEDYLTLVRAPVSDAGETLTRLRGLFANPTRVEPPLQVKLGGRPFVGQFIEGMWNGADRRVFLAAGESGWTLVVQGNRAQWDAVASDLNLTLRTLVFGEGE